MKDIDSPAFVESRLSYERFWEFLDQPSTYCLPLEPVTAGANAGDDVAATLVGVIPADSRLIGGYGVVSANSAGVDASNTSVWVVTVGSAACLTKTNTADLAANTPVSLGTPAATDLAAGSPVTLTITNGAAADLNSAVCHVGLVLADYNNYPAPGLKVIASDGGTVSIADGVKGVVALSPGAADNNEIYMVASTETVKFAAGKSFIGDWLLQFAESTTDDANVIAGFMNAVAANALVDDGAGPRATGDYVAIWKVDGSTKWRAGVQSNGTQIPAADTDSLVTAGGAAHQHLQVKVNCVSATEAVAEFWVDGSNIATIHFAYASATEMQLFVGMKNGGAHAETLRVDTKGYRQLR
jgi:hypothetical protein